MPSLSMSQGSRFPHSRFPTPVFSFRPPTFRVEPGGYPSRNPQRPVRAQLTHTVPQNYGFTAQTSRTRSFNNKFRYPLLFRVHVPGFQRTRRVSHQQFHNSGTALPYSGSPRVGFAVLISTMTALRLPYAIPPHFVSFACRMGFEPIRLQ